MIKFKEKSYSEYDAMRELYNELNKNNYDGRRFEITSKSYLPGVLRGNNIVVEKFTAKTKLIGRDRYRMYIRIGAKAKLPDEVRLPKSYRDESLGGMSLRLGDKPGVSLNTVGYSDTSTLSERLYGPGNNKKKSGNGGGGGGIKVSLQHEVSKLLGDALVYDKRERLLILEFDTVRDAAEALNVLPFGLGYKIYLLD